MHSFAKATRSNGMSCFAGTAVGSRTITSSSITLSACQKPLHRKSWRQMPLMLFGKVAMTLPSHSMKFTTLTKREALHKHPNCVTEQLHGPAQLSLMGCIPLMTQLFHQGASLDRTVSSLISPLPSRASPEFILAIVDRVCCSSMCKAAKKYCSALQC